MKKDQLISLIKLKNSVFTTKDVALLWQETRIDFVRQKLYRYLKAGKIYSIRRGIYAKDKNYSKLELAAKIFTPAYISFESVLAREGVIFQYYGQIFVASYLNRELEIDGQKYSFKKIKNSILTNKLGIKIIDNIFVASKERAFLDTIYLNKEYYFDNLSSIDFEKVDKILPIYQGNKRMTKKVEKYKKLAKEGLN